MYSLNNVTTSADYTDKTTREAGEIVYVDFIVTGAAILWSKRDAQGPWSDDFFLPPTQRGMLLACDGIRVKDAVPGTHAQVTLYLRLARDLPA